VAQLEKEAREEMKTKAVEAETDRYVYFPQQVALCNYIHTWLTVIEPFSTPSPPTHTHTHTHTYTQEQASSAPLDRTSPLRLEDLTFDPHKGVDEDYEGPETEI